MSLWYVHIWIAAYSSGLQIKKQQDTLSAFSMVLSSLKERCPVGVWYIIRIYKTMHEWKQ